MKHYTHSFEIELLKRLKQESKFTQTILGSMQVGKTYGVLHVLEENFNRSDYAVIKSSILEMKLIRTYLRRNVLNTHNLC